MNDDEKEQKQAELVESLTDQVLIDIEEGKNSDKVELMTAAMEEYVTLPNHNIESIKKWQIKISKITQLLEAQYIQIQDDLRNMVEQDPKLSAYNKADQLKEEEK